MDKNGKIADVYVEKDTKDKYHFHVWAEEGMAKAIQDVPGVTLVYPSNSKFEYSVYIDHRYDVVAVEHNIILHLLTYQPSR